MNAQPQPPQPQISIISDKSPSNVTVFIPNLLLLSIHRLIIQNSVPLANHNSAIESIRWFRLLWFSWIFNAYIFFSNFFYIVLIKTCSVWDCLVVFFSACFKVKRTSTHPRWASFFVVVIVLLVSFRKCTVTLLFLVIWGGGHCQDDRCLVMVDFVLQSALIQLWSSISSKRRREKPDDGTGNWFNSSTGCWASINWLDSGSEFSSYRRGKGVVWCPAFAVKLIGKNKRTLRKLQVCVYGILTGLTGFTSQDLWANYAIWWRNRSKSHSQIE